MEEKKNGRRPGFSGAWDLLLKICLPVALLSAGAVVQNRIDIRAQGVQISGIQDSRFTDKDWFVAEVRIMKTIRDVERRLVDAMPPQWVREDLSEIKTMIRDLSSRLDKHSLTPH